MLLAVVTSCLILLQPLADNIPACRRPEWLDNGLPLLALSTLILTFVVAWFSVFFGMVWPKARAARSGFASLAVVALAVFVLLLISVRHGENFNGEVGAMANLRTINTAEITYSSRHDGAWATLEDLVDAMLLDSRFRAQEPIFGYRYNVSLGDEGYVATATRDAANCDARWDFFSNTDSRIKYTTDAARAPRGRAGSPVD